MTTIGTRGCRSAPAIHGAWKRSSPRRGWRPSTTSPPRSAGDRPQAGEQAARVAADAARVRRRPGVEADPHVGHPYPVRLASRQVVKSFYEDVWAELPEDPEPWAWERRRAILLARGLAGERVLDLGCGAGRFMRRCAPRAPTRSASTSPRARSSARGATSPARSCACSGPTEPSRSRTRASTSCGARRCSSTSPTPPALLSEARRVLVTGGRLRHHHPVARPPAPRADRAAALGARTSTRSASTCASTAAARSPACSRRSRSRTSRSAPSGACSSAAPARRACSSRAGARARAAARTGGSRAWRARTGTDAPSA